MAELAPHLMKYDYVEPSLFGELSLKVKNGGNQKINVSPVLDNIDVNINNFFWYFLGFYLNKLELLYDRRHLKIQPNHGKMLHCF